MLTGPCVRSKGPRRGREKKAGAKFKIKQMGSGGAAGIIAPKAGGMLSSRHGRLGFLSMGLLVFQGTALSLTLRYSR